jgi:hypothetical protein
MPVRGLEARARLSEMRKVAFVPVPHGLAAPVVHGALGRAVGVLAPRITGLSRGGVGVGHVGPAHAARAAAHVGTATGIGTPLAILSIPFRIRAAGALIGG